MKQKHNKYICLINNKLKTMKKITLIGSCLIVLLSYTSKAQIISTVAGNGTAGYLGDGGPATSAELSDPGDVKFDAAGNYYIVDILNNNAIREVNGSTGVITTVAGNGTPGFSGDGGAATSAQLDIPGGVAIDNAGNIYIADRNNNRIRKVTKSTGFISTIAGTGTAGFTGDGGLATAAEISAPNGGIAVDASGNIFFGDGGNNRIRVISGSTGIITTIVGNGTAGFSGDGGLATSAEINLPYGIAFDAAGNLYIADQNNNRIRKVTKSTGIITTVAGNGTSGYTGDGGTATSAELKQPAGVIVDAGGNIYISDTYNMVIRKVAAYNGNIYTIAGDGIQGSTGDGGQPTSAELNEPLGLSLSPAGYLYIADWGNHKIRMITSPLAVNELSDNSSIAVYPNPATQLLFVKCTAVSNASNISVMDILGNLVLSQPINAQQSTAQVDITNLAAGMYFVKVTSETFSYVTKFVKK
jgi:hypothetical protein